MGISHSTNACIPNNAGDPETIKYRDTELSFAIPCKFDSAVSLTTSNTTRRDDTTTRKSSNSFDPEFNRILLSSSREISQLASTHSKLERGNTDQKRKKREFRMVSSLQRRRSAVTGKVALQLNIVSVIGVAPSLSDLTANSFCTVDSKDLRLHHSSSSSSHERPRQGKHMRSYRCVGLRRDSKLDSREILEPSSSSIGLLHNESSHSSVKQQKVNTIPSKASKQANGNINLYHRIRKIAAFVTKPFLNTIISKRKTNLFTPYNSIGGNMHPDNMGIVTPTVSPLIARSSQHDINSDQHDVDGFLDNSSSQFFPMLFMRESHSENKSILLSPALSRAYTCTTVDAHDLEAQLETPVTSYLRPSGKGDSEIKEEVSDCSMSQTDESNEMFLQFGYPSSSNVALSSLGKGQTTVPFVLDESDTFAVMRLNDLFAAADKSPNLHSVNKTGESYLLIEESILDPSVLEMLENINNDMSSNGTVGTYDSSPIPTADTNVFKAPTEPQMTNLLPELYDEESISNNVSNSELGSSVNDLPQKIHSILDRHTSETKSFTKDSETKIYDTQLHQNDVGFNSLRRCSSFKADSRSRYDSTASCEKKITAKQYGDGPSSSECDNPINAISIFGTSPTKSNQKGKSAYTNEAMLNAFFLFSDEQRSGSDRKSMSPENYRSSELLSKAPLIELEESTKRLSCASNVSIDPKINIAKLAAEKEIIENERRISTNILRSSKSYSGDFLMQKNKIEGFNLSYQSETTLTQATMKSDVLSSYQSREKQEYLAQRRSDFIENDVNMRDSDNLDSVDQGTTLGSLCQKKTVELGNDEIAIEPTIISVNEKYPAITPRKTLSPYLRFKRAVLEFERLSTGSLPKSQRPLRGCGTSCGFVHSKVTELNGRLRRNTQRTLKETRRLTLGDDVIAPRKAKLINPVFRRLDQEELIDDVSIQSNLHINKTDSQMNISMKCSSDTGEGFEVDPSDGRDVATKCYSMKEDINCHVVTLTGTDDSDGGLLEKSPNNCVLLDVSVRSASKDKKLCSVESPSTGDIAQSENIGLQKNTHEPSILCLSPIQRTPMQAKKWRTLAAQAEAKKKGIKKSKNIKVKLSGDIYRRSGQYIGVIP